MAETSVELPQYQCYKKVRAAKILRVQYNTGGEQAIEDDSYFVWVLDNGGYIHVSKDLKMRGGDNPVGGYYVQYEDGFHSWSPAEVFEKGYFKV